MNRLINIYDEERRCEYKGEIYSVRDNGAVMRHAREGQRVPNVFICSGTQNCCNGISG